MKNNKGITLIALVVTIIVLLILAGVSIAMLTGDNGILTKASEARDSSGAGTLDEAAKIAVGNILTENLKWPYTLEENETTLSSDVVTAAKTKIESEITKTNSNITSYQWGTATGNKYPLSASVDGKTQTINIDLATGAISK